MNPSSTYATVIVPTHDRASTLDLSIRSIQQQTVSDLEIIIAGDGVTPELRAVALRLAGGDSRIVFYDWPKAPDRGGENRGRAVNAAKSERIFYNDDDDLFLPNHVERLGPILDECDTADDATASISLSGRVQISIANHSQGPLRKALAEGTAKLLFDTHFAHRKSSYQRLGNPWARKGDDHVANLFQAFAGDPTMKWRSVPGVTALSFHGAARRNFAPHERRAELEKWYPHLSKNFSTDLAPTAYYDWYFFKLVSDLGADRYTGVEEFLASCHTRLDSVPDRGTADLAVELTAHQLESLRNVWSLAGRKSIENRVAADLAVRLADPLLGENVRYRMIAALLSAALGPAAAIEELRRYQATDQPSHEICECLIGVLLLEQGRLEEAQTRIEAALATARYYRGNVLALAASMARRQSNPGAALDYAEAALRINP
jgi:glycosyltransferase involved in cell wall biosynthesis